METAKTLFSWIFWCTIFSPVIVFVVCTLLFIFTGTWYLENMTPNQFIVSVIWVVVWGWIGATIDDII